MGKLGNCTWKGVSAGIVLGMVIWILRFKTGALMERVVVLNITIALMAMLFKLSNYKGRSMNRWEPETMATLQLIWN